MSAKPVTFDLRLSVRCWSVLGLLSAMGCTDKPPALKPPVFQDSFERAELGPSWLSTAPAGTYRIVRCGLCRSCLVMR
jgi:hypothetical protein